MPLVEIPEWVPPLMCLGDFSGDWVTYLDALYGCFQRDFVFDRPVLDGRPFRLKRYPLSHNKECTFWHLISEGEDEDSRIPDMRRCERLCWVRPMIESIGTERVRAWIQERRDKSIIVTLPDFSYKVVIADRGRYLLPWTAYCIEREHQRRKLEAEYGRSAQM